MRLRQGTQHPRTKPNSAPCVETGAGKMYHQRLMKDLRKAGKEEPRGPQRMVFLLCIQQVRLDM